MRTILVHETATSKKINGMIEKNPERFVGQKKQCLIVQLHNFAKNKRKNNFTTLGQAESEFGK